MLCTLEGEGTGAKGKDARERQAFDDASRMLREYLQPFFDEAERRHRSDGIQVRQLTWTSEPKS